jgi:hypothetical protein
MYIAIRKKLTKEEAEEVIPKIENWFKENTKRKVCITDYGEIRKKFIREDILSHSES